jgi:hypothetical protein
MMFSPCECTTYNNKVEHHFLIAYMSLILLQLEFGLDRVLQE